MNLTDIAEARFNNGYSCSQSVFSALAERWNIGPDVSLRVSAGFGGGISRSAGICGCVTGAIMALGLAQNRVDPEANPSEKEKTYEVCREFMHTFAERNGSAVCAELLGCDISTPEGFAVHQQGVHRPRCLALVRDAVGIVESMLNGSTAGIDPISPAASSNPWSFRTTSAESSTLGRRSSREPCVVHAFRAPGPCVAPRGWRSRWGSRVEERALAQLERFVSAGVRGTCSRDEPRRIPESWRPRSGLR